MEINNNTSCPIDCVKIVINSSNIATFNPSPILKQMNCYFCANQIKEKETNIGTLFDDKKVKLVCLNENKKDPAY